MGDIKYNNGTGHTSNELLSEYLEDEISPNLNFCESGLVAMANIGPNTNGSQFFITLDDLPFLNGKYTIIGKVVKGNQILTKLAAQCGTLEGKSICDVKISNTGIYCYFIYNPHEYCLLSPTSRKGQ